MAARARQTRRTAAAAKATPAPKAQAVAEQDDDDEDATDEPEPVAAFVPEAEQDLTAEDDGGDNAIHITAEDFRDNPAVINMADVVDANLDVDEETGDATEKPPVRRGRRGPAVEATPADEYPDKGRVKVRLVAMSDGSQPPYGAQVIVPDGSDEDPDYDGSHNEGETVTFRRGRVTTVSARGARWLAGHPAYIVQKA